MSVPSVSITKVDGNTGVVRPSPTGVLAIVAPCEKGTLNAPLTVMRDDVARTEFGYGPLTEDAAYELPASGNPALLVLGDATTAGDYGAFVVTNAGTSIITEGVTEPLDAFDVVVQFTVGATVGVAGAKYKVSLNGGASFGKLTALGTANTITIPNTGVSLALAAGTILATTKVAFPTTAPKMVAADVPASLEALRVATAPFECVFLDLDATSAIFTVVANWLAALNLTGRFKTAVLNFRRRAIGTESEAAYATAFETEFGDSVSPDIVVCADGGDVTSSIRALTQFRPTALAVAARGMKVPLGVDVAYINDGPVPGFKITNERGNPKYHDEANYPGIDDVRGTALRSVDGRQGAFINNARLMSAAGSDYVFWQHARTINRACEIAFQILTGALSKGVQKDPVAGPAGERYIAEHEALEIEALANAAIRKELQGQVDDIQFRMSRTDDISSNQGANINAAIENVALGYIKKFTVTAGFVKQLSAPVGQ
jgi:hypothetical protein